jgi:hypothetical protein
MCCTIGMSGHGNGGGLCVRIYSGGDVSDSSMLLTTVTTTGNTATGTMRRALLCQHDLWVVPVDSEWLCVYVGEGWGLVGSA